MKFAWKVFFSCLLVLVIAFTIISYILTTNAFDTALAQEKQRTLEKLQMLMTVVESFTANMDYYADDSAYGAVMEGVATGDFASARLYDKDGATLFPTLVAANTLLEAAQEGIVYDIVQNETAYLMRCCAPVQLGRKVGYLYLEQDVSAPFALYDSMTQTATVVMLIAVALVGAVLLTICTLLTRPVRRLSLVTRRMAGGDYSQRAVVSTQDEIGELTLDFNHMADALQTHVHELEDGARAREDFVSSFAHELKTPLTSIIGYADMLRSQQMDEEAHFKSANYIFTEGRRLERLSLKLLELMVLNRQTFDQYPMETADLAQRMEETANAVLKEKYGVSLRVDMPDATLLIEPDLVLTLLLNLIDNAGKASESGQTVGVCGKCVPAGYRVSVCDHGRGIPKEELEKITQAFYMVDKSRARAQNGAGLGLALCDTIARLHGTKLDIQSELGQGTVISVLLPYHMEGADEEV